MRWWKRLFAKKMGELATKQDAVRQSADLRGPDQVPSIAPGAPPSMFTPLPAISASAFPGFYETKSAPVVREAAAVALKQMRSGEHERDIAIYFENEAGERLQVVPSFTELARPEDDWHEPKP